MEAWVKVQKATFGRWINMHVPEQHFTDWENGFSDGLVLITLLEKLSGKSIRFVPPSLVPSKLTRLLHSL